MMMRWSARKEVGRVAGGLQRSSQFPTGENAPKTRRGEGLCFEGLSLPLLLRRVRTYAEWMVDSSCSFYQNDPSCESQIWPTKKQFVSSGSSLANQLEELFAKSHI
ncbi:hypothetical protein SUGI_0229550 [Cryptomeria japonica]|nr:hypothetical protein SUGI_0229550 [Cryptomeria japonica]